MIHSRLDPVMAEFDMSWNEFVDQRPIFNRNYLVDIVDGYSEYNGEHSLEEVAQNWLTWNALTLEEKLTFAERYYNYLNNYPSEYPAQWSTLSSGEKQDYVEQTAEHVDLNEKPLINDILLPREALAACLSLEW